LTAAKVIIFFSVLLLANLPWLSRVYFGCFTQQSFFFSKQFWWRKSAIESKSFPVVASKSVWGLIVELMVGYCVWLLIGFLLESYLSQSVTQTWPFYVITLCVFLVVSFPGFVFRKLYKY
jgi:Protein of unknown function (DUF2818)